MLFMTEDTQKESTCISLNMVMGGLFEYLEALLPKRSEAAFIELRMTMCVPRTFTWMTGPANERVLQGFL